MAHYLCRNNEGPYYLASEFLAGSLDNESLRGPVNVPYAMRIRKGTGTRLDMEPWENKYRWASAAGWRVIYWPEGGGSEGYIADGAGGWQLDTDDAMPHEVWIILLRLLDAPLVGELPMGFHATRACENSGQ